MDIQRWRDRLNTLVLILPGQWFGLMAIYWLRFYYPLRPYHFQTPFPDATLFLLGCAVCVVPFILPKGYFMPRPFERGGFYRKLGIHWFRYWAPDGDLINGILRRTQPSYRAIRDCVALRQHIEGTYQNERWHLSFFIAGMLTFCHAITTGQLIFGSLLLLTNVLFNLLPVCHQRYKRARARHVLQTVSYRSNGA
jgi:hypothetical protein